MALDLGATDFITKPFSSVDLLARARAHASHRRIARRLEQQITLDEMTGLANKAGFLDRLQQDIAFAVRHAQPVTLARIDIDDFRNVFLKRGKAAAEALVKHIAQVLHDTVRKEDTAARVGLASFALALPAGQHEGSRGLVNRMRARFASEDFSVDGKPLRFTISAAVVTPELSDSSTPVQALDACEALLQVALREGGNRVEGGLRAPLDVPEGEPAAAVVDASPGAPVMARVEISRTPAAAPVARSAPSEVQLAKLQPPPAPAAQPVERVDEALACIERGESLAVLARIPQLLKRLVPLLRLLSAPQRAQLIAFLQKLGT
jgi:diguanylate cyclase (GGDEF)-like protein